MAYTTAEGRQQVLDELAEASDTLGHALASMSEAYEQLDEQTADRVEEELFRPVQRAYGRARSTYASFAQRHELPARELTPSGQAAPARGVSGLIEAAVGDVQRADVTLGSLQDSMLPIEVGDAELRAGLAQVRELISGVPSRARELLRTRGR